MPGRFVRILDIYLRPNMYLIWAQQSSRRFYRMYDILPLSQGLQLFLGVYIRRKWLVQARILLFIACVGFVRNDGVQFKRLMYTSLSSNKVVKICRFWCFESSPVVNKHFILSVAGDGDDVVLGSQWLVGRVYEVGA